MSKDDPDDKGYPVTGRLRKVVGLTRLESRVRQLEIELDEYRQSHVRLAELIDLVQELLLPVAQQDGEKVAQLVRRYSDELED
ncbi:MAG: hypothetical protein FWE71_11485 [Nocardioidaceae bacterium]|nr:hypothetical protein [Nocardioidaceae bacterium]MCL2613081.1 hypothetical protein [Nocardioidaceae bacterium]